MAKTKTVWKYQLDFDTPSQSCELLLPAISIIRHIDIQGKDGGIFLWAEVVASEQPDKRRLFELYGTGWELEDRPNSQLLHLKTLLDGAYVWHIYERVYAPTEAAFPIKEPTMMDTLGLSKRESIAAILFAGLLANPTTFAKKEESWLSSEGDSDGGDDQIPSDEAAIQWADSLLEKLGKTQ